MTLIQSALERGETLERVDRPAGALQRWLNQRLPDQRPVVPPLAGSWLGHPLHPILVLAPIGTWLSAGLLDLVPEQEVAARRLVLTGLVAAVPAMAAGAVDYRKLDQRQRRIGFLHLVSNVAAAGCYAASYRARRQGRSIAGKVWGLAGLAAVSAGGTLGGHLTYAQGVGVYRWQPDRRGDQPAQQTARELAEQAATGGSGGG